MIAAYLGLLLGWAILAAGLVTEARAARRWRALATHEHQRAETLRASLVTLQLAHTYAATAPSTDQEDTDAREP